MKNLFGPAFEHSPKSLKYFMPYYAAIFQILRCASYNKRPETGRPKGAPRWLISAKLNSRRFRPALPELADNASSRSPKGEL